jgi:hypothetical protein
MKANFFKLAKSGLRDVFEKSSKLRKIFDLLLKLLQIVKEFVAIIKDINSLSCNLPWEILSFRDI